ncbi:MAG: helix-turn-helix domain-containing protein [Velocimicrobium sp.]
MKKAKEILNNTIIGNRITQLREADSNKTQEKFSEQIEIDAKKLSRIENGHQTLTACDLYLISCYLGKSMEYILLGKETKLSENQIDVALDAIQNLKDALENIKKG